MGKSQNGWVTLSHLLSFDSSSITFSRFSSKALSFVFCAAATIYDNKNNKIQQS